MAHDRGNMKPALIDGFEDMVVVIVQSVKDRNWRVHVLILQSQSDI